MKLGKLPPVHDPRTLLLSNYLNPEALPVVPDTYYYAKSIGDLGWGMMGNDKINNCTCAAAGHLIMEWTEDNNEMITPTDQDIINAYAAVTGYNPATGQNDIGADGKDVLNYWRKSGISTHKILAYTALDSKNNRHMMQAVYLFGGCYIGLELPLSAKNQPLWSVPVDGATGDGAPASWGGHVVSVTGYDTDGLTIVTWGATKKMTWAFLNTYCDEAYAIISTDFAGIKGAPNGLDLATLKQDLKKIITKA